MLYFHQVKKKIIKKPFFSFFPFFFFYLGIEGKKEKERGKKK